MGNLAFGGMTPDAQRKLIQKAIEASLKGARVQEPAKALPMLSPPGMPKGAVPPPPPGFRLD